MRILHVNVATSASSVDGIGAVIATLAAAQRHAGHTVGALDAAWRADRSLAATALAVVRAIAGSGADVVHLHSVYRPLHLVAAVACGLTGTAYVVSPHSGLAPAGRRRQRRRKALWIALVEKPVLHAARGVVCLSELEATDVRALVPRARTVIVHNPVALPAPCPRPARGSHDPALVVTLTRFDVFQKGLDLLVDLARVLPEVRFHIYGELDRNDVEASRALIAAAPHNVRFLPPVIGERKHEVLARADLYLQLSRWEGQSIAVLEAMAVALPCVVSSYIAQTLGSGRAAVIEAPPSTAAAAATIRAALADPARCRALAETAGQWARAATEPQAVRRELDAVYACGATTSRRATRMRPAVSKRTRP